MSNSDGVCRSAGNALTIKDARYIVLQTYEDTAPDHSTSVIKRKNANIIHMMMDQARNLGRHTEELISK